MADEFKYKHRAGTAAQWADPQDGPLLQAEIGVLLDDDGTPLDAKIGDGETAFADLPSLGGPGGDSGTLTISEQTASYTLVLGDAGNRIEMNVADANALTVPPDSEVAFPVGTVIEVGQIGAGQTTITAGTGVTIQVYSTSTLALAGQWASASLLKRATDEWVLTGDLAAA